MYVCSTSSLELFNLEHIDKSRNSFYLEKNSILLKVFLFGTKFEFIESVFIWNKIRFYKNHFINSILAWRRSQADADWKAVRPDHRRQARLLRRSSSAIRQARRYSQVVSRFGFLF